MRLRRSATDFKHFRNKNGRFSVKTYHFCVIARRAQFLRPTRQSLTERDGIPERSLEKQREAVCVLHARHHLVLPVSCSRIKQQAGANKSVCSCLFYLQRACPPNLLARRHFNDPAYCIALFHTIPLHILPIAYRLGRKKYPSRTRREKAAARKAANEILRREFGASVFGLFAAYPMARIANAEKMCYNFS